MTNTRSRVASTCRAVAPLAFIGFLAAALLLFPPAQYSFYPECPIYRYLHMECPGCGTTRAIAALLHGHFTEALRLNALTTILLPPTTIIYAVTCYRRLLRCQTFHWPQPPAAAIYSALAIAAIFTLARNLGYL